MKYNALFKKNNRFMSMKTAPKFRSTKLPLKTLWDYLK